MEFNRVGLIRLGKGQHAMWMHSALPRIGFIPLGCGTGDHDDSDDDFSSENSINLII